MGLRITLDDDEINLLVWLLDDAMNGGTSRITEIAMITHQRLMDKLKPKTARSVETLGADASKDSVA